VTMGTDLFGLSRKTIVHFPTRFYMGLTDRNLIQLDQESGMGTTERRRVFLC
jgi:hypothetical protein